MTGGFSHITNNQFCFQSGKQGITTGHRQSRSLFLIFYFLFFILLLSACASIGSPDGGPYDETPPKVLYAMPANQAVNADKQKMSIFFDEYIKIENASEKVVVSPPQKEMPNVRAVGKHISIELFDTLLPNTTYTIDFSDAIVDNNEGNPMGNYTYSFSTGDVIDTMEVSGYVLNAADLEPLKGVLVGLYEENADGLVPDSLFRTRAFDRVSRTNGSGRFVIRGVAPGRRYRAFALKDMDNDFRFSQKSELLGWDTTLFSASCGPDIRLDTIWADSTHYDSIQPVHYTHFYPDDIVIRAFVEEGQDRHLLKTQRDIPEKFTVFFTAPADSLPRINGINFEGDGGFIVEPSAKGDTITYWITDTAIAYNDTLIFDFTYLDTDTLHQLVWKTDSALELVPKTTRAKQLQELAKKTEEWEKEQKKKQKKVKNLQPEENPYLITYLSMSCKPSGGVDPFQKPRLTFSEPVSLPDSSAVHFRMKVDTLWTDVPFELTTVEGAPCDFQLSVEWELGQQYSLEIDSAAVRGALGHTNQPLKQDFRVRKEEEYGALFIHALLPDTGVVVQLLNGSDKPVRTERADPTGRADFFYLKPGDYYLRCFVDRNGDGVWTTGEFDSANSAEEVFYFPKPMTVKAQWEIDQQWDVRGIAVMKQKPKKITKQKPDKEKKTKDRNKERDAAMKRQNKGKR
ncbi:MAG: Ig-like domain-containing protein [Bacteroidaceae bacterium]|nr:Ig-like domain-containing protein [Bacteroidaceae bacterium]